jgi:chemotaxis protein methyltransferase CheR
MTVNFPGVTLYRKESKRPQIFEVVQHSADEGAKIPFQPLFESFPERTPALVPPVQSKEAPQLETSEPETVERVHESYTEALRKYTLGDYQGTVDQILHLPATEQSNPRVLALITRAYANQGNLTEAAEWCEKAIRGDKLNPASRFLLATILEEQGRHEDAVTSLRHTLYIEPDFVLAHFSLGNLMRRQGKSEEADKHLSNALAILRRHPADEVVPESDGITAGRLAEMITAMK